MSALGGFATGSAPVQRGEGPVFPLVPRRRVSGVSFGTAQSRRRGRGADVAGSRAYVRGDPLSTIDWRASARLSTARNDDEFIVRERFADESPRVVILCDRRPSMALYGPPFPWLSKPAAVRAAVDVIVASAHASRAPVGYLDHGGADEEPLWIPPRNRAESGRILERQRTGDGYDGSDDALERGLGFLAGRGSELPSGSFVFVCSDFSEPPSAETWIRVTSRRWDVVPVVVQDPTWEQSFPLVGGISLPLVDPRGGRAREVRLTGREARLRREANERARAELLESFASLDLDPVLVDSDAAGDVARAFLDWAERRRRLWRRR